MKIYLIKTSASDLYKIGRSENVKNRLKQIKGSMSFVDIFLIHTIDYDCENALHEFFKEKRSVGEWFLLSEEDIALIKAKEWGNDNYTVELDSYLIEYSKYKGISTLNIKASLSETARLLYDYIKHTIKNSKNLFCIDKNEFMKLARVKSQTTFITAKKELIKSEILIPTNKSFYGWFYVNEGFIKY
jgi:hypothetical protein